MIVGEAGRPVSVPLPGGGNRDLGELRRAERIVLGLRWLAVLSWPAIFAVTRIPWRPELVWPVYAGIFLYAIATHVWIRRPAAAIRAVATLTTVGDSLAIAAMCLVSGGVVSDVYPVFYLAVLATSIRFGMKETFAVLGLNGLLSFALFFARPVPVAELAMRLFYLSFIGLIGALLSRDVRAARDRNRSLLWRTIHAGEEERRRLAGEIHDDVGARLFEFLYAIRQSRDRVGEEAPLVGRELEALEDRARDCSQALRRVMNDLRPSVLDDLGFVEALREYVSTLQDQGGLAVRLRVDGAIPAVPPLVGTMLFRVLQEALLNARKHAAARNVEVELRRRNGRLELSIRDDGRGFDPRRSAPGHYGLLYMRERAEACGGELAIDSRAGEGTEVCVSAPLDGEPRP